MKTIEAYIREKVEAVLNLTSYEILTNQRFGNDISYYLLCDQTLMDVITLGFQKDYFTTNIRSVVWEGHVAGTPEGSITKREGVLPNGLGMIYHNENTRQDFSQFREYISWMKKRYIVNG